MRRVLFGIFMLIPLPAVASVSSDLAAIESKHKVCLDKNAADLAMKMCAADAYEAADKVLGDVYRKATARLKDPKADPSDAADRKEILKRLIASERAWLSFREADCDLQGTEMLGGTGESLRIEDCMFERTSERARDLDKLLNVK